MKCSKTGVAIVLWIIGVTYLFARLLSFQDGQLMIGNSNAYGDWALHLTWVSTLAFRTLFPSSHPVLITADAHYPYAVNFLSAVLIRAGLPFWSSFLLPQYVALLALLPLSLGLLRKMTHSLKLALLTFFLWLTNGGNLFWEKLLGGTIPTDFSFTMVEKYGYVWGNIVHTQLIPQRAMTLGLSLGVGILLGFYVLFLDSPAHRKLRWLVFSLTVVAFALLPFIHTHSLIAVGFICASWSVVSLRQKNEFMPLVGWWLLAIPLSLIVFTTFIGWDYSGFLKWYPGWYARTQDSNWLLLWWKNWTVIPFLSLGALVWLIKTKQAVWKLLLPFFLLFGLANLFLFQPYPFDNTKILTYASLGMIISVVFLLRHWWRQRLIKKVLVVVIIILVSASGVREQVLIFKQLNHPYTLYSQEDLQLAAWVRANIPNDQVFLTPTNHNQWLYNLTGRQTILGYDGWLWSYGFDYLSLQQAVNSVQQGTFRPDLPVLEQADFIILNQPLSLAWQAHLKTERFKLIFSSDSYSIVEIKR